MASRQVQSYAQRLQATTYGRTFTSKSAPVLGAHENKTFGEVYPILAAFTVTRTFDFWAVCSERLLALDDKFHYWYGDQEAARMWPKQIDLGCASFPSRRTHAFQSLLKVLRRSCCTSKAHSARAGWKKFAGRCARSPSPHFSRTLTQVLMREGRELEHPSVV